MKYIIEFISAILIKLGLNKIISDYSEQSFITVRKSFPIDVLLNDIQSLATSKKWEQQILRVKDSSFISTYSDGGMGISWPRGLGVEVRTAPDSYFVWLQSKYARAQAIDRGENAANINAITELLQSKYGIIPTTLDWKSAAAVVSR